jgi:UDP-N-acetylmuramoyl-L-alanyl-D-glutamate--2,6-diaminopimelate ligase
MGAIAERLADRVIVSDDNPRGESGDAIVADILAGMCRPADAIVRRDRAAAIAAAIGPARDGDVVLVAGKGHEPYQEVAGVRHRFNDARVVARILEAQP